MPSMTFGWGLMTVGSVMLLSGYQDKPISAVLGEIQKKPAAGDTSFSAYLKGAGSGISDAFTGSGETGSTSGATGKVPTGMAQFDGHTVCKWIAEELEWARQRGWKGSVNSGFRDYQEQVQACKETTGPCADPGTSNHEGTHYPSCAVDVTNEEELDKILSKKIGRRLHWTGKSIGDNVHFSSGLNGV